jgi:phosphate transport system protein
MPRETFERELNKLQDDLLVLGSMVEQAVLSSIEALKQRDFESSKKIFAADKYINIKRYEIEQNTLALIATQQPMARDLRLLAAILEIITELERIGDYAKGICKHTTYGRFRIKYAPEGAQRFRRTGCSDSPCHTERRRTG